MTSSHETSLAETARTYALVGFIFYVLATIACLIGIVFFLSVSFWFGWMPPQVPRFFPLFPVIPLSVFCVIDIAFSAWSWITIKNIDVGKYSEARTASLILGIFGIFLAWLIGGIFLILAHMKLSEVLQPPQPAHIQRFCLNCGRSVIPDAKYCPHCGKELPP